MQPHELMKLAEDILTDDALAMYANLLELLQFRDEVSYEIDFEEKGMFEDV